MDYGDGLFREKAAAIIDRELPGIGNERIRRRKLRNRSVHQN
jgi:hypothetical protein